MEMVVMPAMQNWTAWDLVLVFLMWAVMMVAMMVPTVSPAILLFTEINRRRDEQKSTRGATGAFLLGYLTAWNGFSILATLVQWGLLTAALVSPMMESTSKALGASGAFRMGLKHGGYCRGCCWALMGLLFAFGVMNLLWVAGLSAFVLLEKIGPKNQLVSRLSGLLFIAWAAWMAVGQHS
jgi:predicted metal-binding membrane protein